MKFIGKIRLIGSDRLILCLKAMRNLEIFFKSALKNIFSAKIKHLEYAFHGKYHLVSNLDAFK